jgi:hypothetical protein
MSAFVSQENQVLLWNVISKNRMIQEYFDGYPDKKNQWFRSVIGSVYNNNQTQHQTLLELNKFTLNIMVQNIKDQIENKPNQSITAPIRSTVVSSLESYSISEHKVDKIGNQFQEKQTEYNTIFDKKVPESPDFSEKHDEPLSNMDDLIKRHLQEREEELRKYAPLPLVQSPITEVKQPTNKIAIQHNNDSKNAIQIEIEEVEPAIGKDHGNDYGNDSTKTRKSVNWLDDASAERLETQQREIEILKRQVEELMAKVMSLEGQIGN